MSKHATSETYQPLPMVRLEMGGKAFEGWTSATITSPISALSGDFSLDLVAPDLAKFLKVQRESEDLSCKIYLGDEPIMTGYVDRVDASLNADQHTLTVQGRGKASDLVDSYVLNEGNTQEKPKLLSVIERLLKPYGIAVKCQEERLKDLYVSERVQFEVGLTVFQAVAKLCSKYNVFVLPSHNDWVVLSTRSTPSEGAGLLSDGKGGNILTASTSYAMNGLHAKYVAFGDSAGGDVNPVTKQAVYAVDIPAFAKRPRVKVIQAQESAELTDLMAMAKAEYVKAKGDATILSLTAWGWHGPNGKLWRVGTRIPVRIQGLGISNTYVATKVVYTYSSSGRATAFTLVEADTFKPAKVGGAS